MADDALERAHKECERLFPLTVLAGVTADQLPKTWKDDDPLEKHLSPTRRTEHREGFIRSIRDGMMRVSGAEIYEHPSGRFRIEFRQINNEDGAAAAQAVFAHLQQQGIQSKCVGNRVGFVLEGEPLQRMKELVAAHKVLSSAQIDAWGL